MRQEYTLNMSLHDLWVRNRGQASQDEDSKSKVDPMPSSIDKPPATIPQK
jgi:hypothetical protein